MIIKDNFYYIDKCEILERTNKKGVITFIPIKYKKALLNSNEETFTHLKGFGRSYLFSNYGNIYNVKTKKFVKTQKTKTSNNIITQLKRRGKYRVYTVSSLIMRAFTKGLPDNIRVSHIDGNLNNNKLNNLCIYNKYHRFKKSNNDKEDIVVFNNQYQAIQIYNQKQDCAKDGLNAKILSETAHNKYDNDNRYKNNYVHVIPKEHINKHSSHDYSVTKNKNITIKKIKY